MVNDQPRPDSCKRCLPQKDVFMKVDVTIYIFRESEREYNRIKNVVIYKYIYNNNNNNKIKVIIIKQC